MTSRPSTAAPILAVLAILLPFVLYVGGYFWLGTVANVTELLGKFRTVELLTFLS
jgi:hypothetical protein